MAMIKLAIRGPNFSGRSTINPRYRGIERVDLPYTPNDHIKAKAVNDAFELYMNNSNISKEDGEYLEDYELAKQLALTYTQNNETGDLYEVIELVYPNEYPVHNKKLLGYDIIMENEGGSAIINIFNETGRRKLNPKDFNRYLNALNENFLFSKMEIAEEFCKDACKIVDKYIDLKIIGLYGCM